MNNGKLKKKLTCSTASQNRSVLLFVNSGLRQMTKFINSLWYLEKIIIFTDFFPEKNELTNFLVDIGFFCSVIGRMKKEIPIIAQWSKLIFKVEFLSFFSLTVSRDIIHIISKRRYWVHIISSDDYHIIFCKYLVLFAAQHEVVHNCVLWKINTYLMSLVIELYLPL